MIKILSLTDCVDDCDRIACVLQTEINEDTRKTPNDLGKMFDYELLDIIPDIGGPLPGHQITEKILAQTSSQKELRPLLLDGKVPTIDTIRK